MVSEMKWTRPGPSRLGPEHLDCQAGAKPVPRLYQDNAKIVANFHSAKLRGHMTGRGCSCYHVHLVFLLRTKYFHFQQDSLNKTILPKSCAGYDLLEAPSTNPNASAVNSDRRDSSHGLDQRAP
jgi:hypothetical protein